MLLRNLNLAGPFPISRDGKILGELLKAALVLLPDAPIFADVELTDRDPIRATIKLKAPVSLEFNPGFAIRVYPNRTVDVCDQYNVIAATFVFPPR